MYMTPGTSGLHSQNISPMLPPPPQEPKPRKFLGLGDVVHAVMKKTGIEKLVKKATKGKDCGCAKRRDTLNKAVPFIRGSV